MRQLAPPAVAAAALTVAVAAAAAAQNGPLVGFTASSTNPSSSITRQSLCTPPSNVCPNALPGPSQPHAGGAAYSPMRDSVFHTQGTRILELDRSTCTTRCALAATRSMGPTSLASGLAINPARNEMYELETVAGVGAVTTWRFGSAVCPQPGPTCRILLPTPLHRAGAIAFDQRRDIVYVAASLFGAAVPANFVLLYRRGDPACMPFCRLAVDRCLNGTIQSIRAMAYDACRDEIHVSDGRQTSVQSVIWSAGARCPTLRPRACCALAHPQGELWQGFDILSTRPRNLGGSCTQRPCPSCPSLALHAVGAAVPGNGSFGFRIENGPTGSLGAVFVGFGACTPGLPFLCGRFFLPLTPPPIAIGSSPLGGSSTCDGTASYRLPVPDDFSFCGALLCVQGAVVCRTPVAIGVGLTNAVVVPIGP